MSSDSRPLTPDSSLPRRLPPSGRDFYVYEPNDKEDPPEVVPETYFEKEGLSYEYPTMALAGRTRPEVLDYKGSSEIWVVYDFNAFHGTPGENGARNFAYLDGHVDAVIVAE